MGTALRRHWPEYLAEAACLGLFMVSAALFAALLELPGSPARQALPEAFARRALMGLAMGATAVALICSPLGQRSGAHMNPAVTLTFWRLGKLEPADAVFYVAFQFAGGLAGILLASALLGARLAAPEVNWVATLPGPAGPGVAFAAEVAISALLMLAILLSSNSPRFMRATPWIAGLLVAAFITFEAPLSGMSINPARTFASAAPGGIWRSLWLYFVAPPLGMGFGAWLYVRGRAARRVHCAKLHHHNDHRCIFRCQWHDLEAATERS